MTRKQLLLAGTAALVVVCSSAVRAGQTIDEAGALVCVTDKWDEQEPEKGHKLVDYAGRCIAIPDSAAAPKQVEECSGKYEFMPDESWKGNGSCTYKFKDSEGTVTDTFEEGSDLKEYVYKITGGTGKYQGATGGTYSFDNLTDTLRGGRYKGQIVLP
jgi:hypothetical protein